MKLICPDCGTQYDSGKFCQECGAKLQEVAPELVCPSCGYKATLGKFCPECGTKLAEQIPTLESSTLDVTPKRTFNERDSRFAKFYGKKGFPRTIPQEERAIAKEELAPFVEQGIAEAKMLLANILCTEATETGNKESWLEVISLLQEAEADGDKLAYYLMGIVYLAKGDPVELNDAEKRLLECQKQYGETAGLLASLYAYSEEKRDYRKAFDFATIAAEEDDGDGYQVLGALYLNGWSAEKNLDKALEYYTQAAALGDVTSMNQIGYIYLGEEGGKPNPKQAFYWFNEASKKGDDAGMYNLGYCYKNGIGVEADAEIAAEWFKKSADMGYVRAMMELGDYYQDVLFDDTKAKKWYTKAAETGDAEAQNKLSVFYADKEYNYDEALKWCHKAMEQGYAWAFRNYAWWLWEGNGCEEDKGKAMEMMEKAASLRLPEAKNELKEMRQVDAKEIHHQSPSESIKGASQVEVNEIVRQNEWVVPEGTSVLNFETPESLPDSSLKWRETIETIQLPKSLHEENLAFFDNSDVGDFEATGVSFYAFPNLKKVIIPTGEIDRFSKMSRWIAENWYKVWNDDGTHIFPEVLPVIKNKECFSVTNYSDISYSKWATNLIVSPECNQIPKNAFSFNKKLQTVYMFDTVEEIGKKAFYCCKGLKEIKWSKNAKTIEKDVLNGCEELRRLVIPEGVTTIEEAAFAGCKSLVSITLPSTIDSIEKGGTFGLNPFQLCNSLKEIIVPKGTKDKFEQLLDGFSGNPAKFLVESK